MTKLYLAGPMTGYPRWNFDAFAEATAALRAAGYEVISPAEHDLAQGFDPDAPVSEYTLEDRHAAMRADIEAVLSVDGLATLPGWEASEGATLEVAVAQGIGAYAFPVGFYLSLSQIGTITE